MFGTSLMLFLFFLAVTALMFWIWMIVECATKEPSQGNDKIVWIVIIVFAQLIGALIYYFVRRPQRILARLAGIKAARLWSHRATRGLPHSLTH